MSEANERIHQQARTLDPAIPTAARDADQPTTLSSLLALWMRSGLCLCRTSRVSLSWTGTTGSVKAIVIGAKDKET